MPRKLTRRDDLSEIVPVNTKFVIDATGRAICGATNRLGNPCANTPLGNGRCRYHGGLTPKGPANANYKHGRYSKYLSPRLGQIVEEMATDPNRLDQTSQMAILDALLIETLKDFEAGGGGRIWDELMKLKQDYDRAGARKDAATQVAVVREVWDLVSGAAARYMASKEARDIIDHRLKLTESERRRMIEDKQMIPLDQVVLALAKIGDSIRLHIPEDRVKQLIFNDVMLILGSFTANQQAYYGTNARPEDD